MNVLRKSISGTFVTFLKIHTRDHGSFREFSRTTKKNEQRRKAFKTKYLLLLDVCCFFVLNPAKICYNFLQVSDGCCANTS